MTFRSSRISVFAVIALAAKSVFAATPNSLILFIPEALPAMGVEQGSAPTLTRLRAEGVNFANSHSGFPRLAPDDETVVAPTLQPLSLVAAATREYSASFGQDMRLPGSEELPELRQFLDQRLPDLKKLNRPFLFVYRLVEPRPSAPPSGQTRRAYKTDPRAADAALTAIEESLKSLGLFETTNIVVAAEHGLSRVVKVSNTSSARKPLPREETLGILPPGFVAIDLLAAVQTEDSMYSLFDTDNSSALVNLPTQEHPKGGNAVIAADYDPANPYLTVESHGVYDTIVIGDELSKQERSATARHIVKALLEQDYVGAIFVNEKSTGRVRGALPIAHIVADRPDEPIPDVVVAFASVSDGCTQPLTCMSVIADTTLAEGEGIPNDFSRAGTATFMAARGPDFGVNVLDRSPASNADIAATIAELWNLDFAPIGSVKGRVLNESLVGVHNKAMPKARKQHFDSVATEDGSITRVTMQSLGSLRYFDAALSSNQERMALADVRPRRHWRWPFSTFTITISDDKF